MRSRVLVAWVVGVCSLWCISLMWLVWIQDDLVVDDQPRWPQQQQVDQLQTQGQRHQQNGDTHRRVSSSAHPIIPEERQKSYAYEQARLHSAWIEEEEAAASPSSSSSDVPPKHECYTHTAEDDDVFDWYYVGPYVSHPDVFGPFRRDNPPCSAGDSINRVKYTQGGAAGHSACDGVPSVLHFFWETSKGKVPPKCIMLLPMLSVFNTMPDRSILIHSNTLPLDFFSEFTQGTIIIERYNLDELAYSGIPGSHWLRVHLDEFKKFFDPKTVPSNTTSQWVLHHISDYLRLAWLYIYGGTYLDFDFVITRQFPSVSNIISRTEAVGCPKRYKMPSCIPQRFQDCYPDLTNPNATTFFIPHNGALFNFRPQHPYIRRCLELFETYQKDNCKGCAGPGLLTNVFMSYINETGKPPPKLHTMPTSTLVVSYGAGSVRGKVPYSKGAMIIHFLRSTAGANNITLPPKNGTLIYRWENYLEDSLVKKGFLDKKIHCGENITEDAL
ncbi:hypothetical protein Pelo_953 [Pelomyxa schiedti]|nr:hypothetical protein Pelo_953 [Pelomyxa schiedti]